jgi:hypothetical protein
LGPWCICPPDEEGFIDNEVRFEPQVTNPLEADMNGDGLISPSEYFDAEVRGANRWRENMGCRSMLTCENPFFFEDTGCDSRNQATSMIESGQNGDVSVTLELNDATADGQQSRPAVSWVPGEYQRQLNDATADGQQSLTFPPDWVAGEYNSSMMVSSCCGCQPYLDPMRIVNVETGPNACLPGYEYSCRAFESRSLVQQLKDYNFRAERKLGREGVAEAWESQLNRAGSHDEQPPVDEDQSLMLSYKNFTSLADMNEYVAGLSKRIGRIASLFQPPLDLLYKNRTLFTYMPLGAPDGVGALKKMGLAAVKDVVTQRVSLTESLLTCHASSWQEASAASSRRPWLGYCHSAPTSATVWLTRTAMEDGSQLPLLWTCHQEPRKEGARKEGQSQEFKCHVMEKTLIAPSPELQGLFAVTTK